ncbi:hypothetical protein FHX75_121090 [Micromonospora palomenae]|uniref:Uncharacterized protein n=2 Tax=Micromonospora palomenae TaxID=1461247 RepID=A0A561WFB9_9ACTN|nr:hypothetical protein FHX75_121090 [Micromonospora palomenae]
MVNMPAARRHHRSRIGYAFGLLALVGAVTTLVVVVRYPAESATRLAEPVPAPEITVVEQNSPPPGVAGYPGYEDDSDYPADLAAPDDRYGDTAPGPEANASEDPAGGAGSRPGGDEAALAGSSPADARQALSQSLFYSGLLGLTISLAGLGLVGTRRRMW